MRTLLLILLSLLLLNQSSWAKTYSCRDRDGRLHYSDNLQGLPEECWGKEKVVEPGQPDNLQYVPALPDAKGSGHQFRQSVEAVERELQQEKILKQQLQSRAEALLKRYREAVAGKRQAKRSWDYRSREKIKRADEEIARIREEKQQLLDELTERNFSQQEKESIREKLAEIDAE